MTTSNKLMEKLRIVGNALLPTWASASTFKCSKRTSIVGKSSPTLNHETNKITQTCKFLYTWCQSFKKWYIITIWPKHRRFFYISATTTKIVSTAFDSNSTVKYQELRCNHYLKPYIISLRFISKLEQTQTQNNNSS